MKIFVILNLAIVAVSAKLEPRIIKGKNAVERQFPYQVGLDLTNSNYSWWCGGALIDNSWVLTAAHCTINANSVTVYLGATIHSRSKVNYTVSAYYFIEHEKFENIFKNNDIALIQIPAVTFDDYIQKIKLPAISSNYSTYIGERAIATGWGDTSDPPKADIVPNLQYAFLKVIDNAACISSYDFFDIIHSTLCAAPINGSSICQGDSGGPLVTEESNELIGISSFVHQNGCESGAPSGFTRVTSFLPWIKEITGISY